MPETETQLYQQIKAGNRTASKGMTAQLDAQTEQLGLTDAFSSNQLFWMTKTLTFEGTPFKEVMIKI